MKNFARWADRGIRMNVVNPGAVDTPILSDFVSSFGEAASKDIEDCGGVSSAESIAAVIVFVLSDDASSINGVAIPVDGGVLAKIQGQIFGF